MALGRPDGCRFDGAGLTGPAEAPRLFDVADTGDADVGVRPGVRRAAVGFGVVLVLGLLASAIFTSGPEPDEPVVDDAVDTSIAPTTTTDPSAPSSTIAPSTTSPTTTAAEPIEVPADLGFDASPPSGSLVLWRTDDPLLQVLDLAAATRTVIDLDTIGLDLVRGVHSVGDRLIVEGRQGFWWVDADGGFAPLSDGGELRVAGDDEIWISASYVSNREFDPLRVDVRGVAQLLPTVPAGSAPFGYVGDRLLVGGGASGGVYIATSTGYEQIATGSLIGSGGDHLVTRVCDEELVCSIERRSFETGVVQQLPIPDGIDLAGVWWVDDTVSPDAGALLVLSAGSGGVVMWDLVSNTTQPVPLTRGFSATWSSDGAWLFAAADGSVIGVERSTGDRVELETPGATDAAWSLAWLADSSATAAVPSGE